jgi:hypothetical protein
VVSLTDYVEGGEFPCTQRFLGAVVGVTGDEEGGGVLVRGREGNGVVAGGFF